MTPTHIHLMINHFPLFTALMGIALLAYTLITKNKNFEKLYLILFIVSALSIVPTYFSGENAEHAVEEIKGIAESAIHPHEEAGEKALIVTMLLGLFSLGKMFIKNNEKAAKILSLLIIISSISSFALIAYTGNLGGKIRHTELSGDANAVSIESQVQDNENHDDK